MLAPPISSAMASPSDTAGRLAPDRGVRVLGRVHAGLHARAAWTVPVGLTAVYLVLLVARFPALVRWLGTSADNDAGYLIAEAVARGHTGHILLSTQGAWPSLAYGVLTAGLSFHRTLWAISPAVLWLATAVLIGVCVRRLAGTGPGWLAAALMLAVSPTALANLLPAWNHNTTLPGVALLGVFLVWSGRQRRATRSLAAAAAVLSVVIGVLLSADGLLLTEGLLPFAATALLVGLRYRDVRAFAPTVAIVAGACAVAAVTSALMRSLGLATTAPPLHVAPGRVPEHARWLLDGLLRLGDGFAVTGEGPARRLLAGGAALALAAAVILLAVRLARAVRRVPAPGRERTQAVWIVYWALSLVCAAAAYVLTAEVPSDRYVMSALPALAATVPLAAQRRGAARWVAAGATIVVVAGLVSLARSDTFGSLGSLAPQTERIQALASAQHLGVGYAGYWDAEPLTWLSHGRLRVYPIVGDARGTLWPMGLATVSAWYRPRRATPSFLILSPHDELLPDRRPARLPAPERVLHAGPATLLVYPYDIARFLTR